MYFCSFSRLNVKRGSRVDGSSKRSGSDASVIFVLFGNILYVHMCPLIESDDERGEDVVSKEAMTLSGNDHVYRMWAQRDFNELRMYYIGCCKKIIYVESPKKCNCISFLLLLR